MVFFQDESAPEFSQWTTCNSFCDPDVQYRYKLSAEGVKIEV